MDLKVIRYLGSTRDVGTRFKIEIKSGDLVAISPKGEVVVGNVTKEVTKKDMDAIFGSYEDLGYVDSMMYSDFYQKDLAKKHNMQAHEELRTDKITSAHFTGNIDRYTGEVLNSNSKDNIISVSGHPVLIRRH